MKSYRTCWASRKWSDITRKAGGLNSFVSGGTKGVGRAVAEQLAREGCRVAVVARGQQAIDETVEAIRRAGGEAIGISADLYRQKDINRAVKLTAKAFGAFIVFLCSESAAYLTGNLFAVDGGWHRSAW